MWGYLGLKCGEVGFVVGSVRAVKIFVFDF